MSELHNDHNWNREARNVADRLDNNDVYNAQESLRRDLFQLQNDPRAQRDFINMVNRYDHKGIGADINVYRGPHGQEQWQITMPDYGNNRYPYPRPLPQPMPPEIPMPVPMPVPVPVPVPYPDRSPGEAVIDGIATGAGIAIGVTVIDKIFGRDRHDNHRRR